MEVHDTKASMEKEIGPLDAFQYLIKILR
jgi:hypothetical protein